MDPTKISPHDVELREQDRWLPIANVARLMKNTLPVSAKVSKDAKECIQECVSEFISFITSEASDKCLREKRKTINGEDILYSMHDLGFENYAEVLKIYLAKYREQQALKQERGEARSSKRQSKQSNSIAQFSTIKNDEHKDLENAPLNGDKKPNGTQYFEELHHEPELDSNSINVNSAVPSNTSSTSSIDSPEPFFNEYDSNQDSIKLKHDGIDTNDSSVKGEDYRYDDFINDSADDSMPHNGHRAHHTHIDDLTKLTNGEPNIESLTTGITNGNSNGGYFEDRTY